MEKIKVVVELGQVLEITCEHIQLEICPIAFRQVHIQNVTGEAIQIVPVSSAAIMLGVPPQTPGGQ